MEAQVQWTAPSPLWNGALQSTAATGPAAIRQPALLRFASDSFMDDLFGLLQSDHPENLAAQVAQPESYRARPLGEPLSWSVPQLPEDPSRLKLYQPAHGHFYLIAANLVCRIPGMPDRRVNTASAERVSFVLRRLKLVPDSLRPEEMAWVNNPDPAVGKGWQTLAEGPGSVAPYEERLPMFPVSFRQNGHPRRLLVGLVPTSSRETFQAGPELSPIVVDPTHDPRMFDVRSRVLTHLTLLLGAPGDYPANQAQEASLFVLLDLADFLAINLASLWSALLAGSPPLTGDPSLGALYALLDRTPVDDSGTSWRQALAAVWRQRDSINRDGTATDPPLSYNLQHTTLKPADLETGVQNALGTYSPPATPPETIPVPKLDTTTETQYLLRCVYERPHCGPLRPPVVSDPSASFSLASYFDFDAPSRPIRIALPVDTSLAGLRKFRKNVAFVISDKLHAQMDSAADLKKALDGSLATHDAGGGLGTICSFSIPIITICALIVLLMFVILLNLVFWWMPLLRICLPIRLKGR